MSLLRALKEEPVGPPSPLLKSPYPHWEFGARCVEEGCDEYYKNYSFIWLHIIEYGSEDRGPTELMLDGCATRNIGEYPEYMNYLLDNHGGWEDLLEIPKEEHGLLTWSIEKGIHPEQPFLIVVTEPRGSWYWTDCGREYDEYFEVDLVRKGVSKWGPRRYEEMVADQMREPT